jgi:hypothetical protein
LIDRQECQQVTAVWRNGGSVLRMTVFFCKFEVCDSYESSVVKSPPSPSRHPLAVIANHTTMTLKEFIKHFDNANSIVLLEGKRNVLDADKEKLTALGRLLASKTKRMLFRSGNAEGSDQLFSDGVTAVDYKRLQVIIPYSGHRQKTNHAYDTISLDDINIAAEPEVVYQSKSYKKTEKLIDQFVSGDKNRYTIKAAYIIRDTIKVIGTDEIKPATFGIFYDDLDNPISGGTGHTMNVCKKNNIPLIDQKIWFKWLAE